MICYLESAVGKDRDQELNNLLSCDTRGIRYIYSGDFLDSGTIGQFLKEQLQLLMNKIRASEK